MINLSAVETIKRYRLKSLGLALLPLCLALLSCSDSSGPTTPTVAGPDLLMENFKNAWEQMSIVEYQKLLADGFEFFFDPDNNLDDFVGGPSWDRTKEITSATNMFTNQPGYDLVKDEPIPPILNIEFQTFSKITDWSDPGSDPLYAGTMHARYKVSIKVTYQGEALSTLVTGDNDFYATKVNVDGQDLYLLKIWQNRKWNPGPQFEKTSESTSWGYLKAAYK